MVAFGGFIATLAAFAWGVVYAFTQNILRGMSPLNLLTATYLFSGLLTLVPYSLFGDRKDLIDGIAANPKEFVFYVVLIVVAKFFMIVSVKLIGATAAGLVEISYVSGSQRLYCYM